MDMWLSQLAPVMTVANTFGVQPRVVALAGLLWLGGFWLWGFTGELLCTLVGLSYPMYASFKVLEDEKHEDAVQWLTYWVTYAAIAVAENLFHGLLVWLPLYCTIRLVFTLWLFLPWTRGASCIYRWLLAPLLRRQQTRIDAVLERSTGPLQGDLLSKELREKLCQAIKASTANGSIRDLGIDDLVAQELSKAAAARLDAVRRGSENQPSAPQQQFVSPAGHLGARRRSASPKPTPLLEPTLQVLKEAHATGC
eukprot:CAMPEP_0172728494 /NCGR_PEP_ID=MMETSP1074-20121228/92276_1 /TAXON_ID=2916 /ORGANISM="Ceratium fusus, Strain PA161109" /LENGTH=252 /DNA_ID=CAMNT_0013555751 /DNA_START=98 /DNA_END=856 /DNA_ORIENTATION=-